MDKEPDNGAELVRQKDTSLFKPSAEDIFDDVFNDLDSEQAAQVKAKAAEEAMRLVAEKKRGEIKYANASRDIENFVNNADLMDQRKKDYQMRAEFEGASAITKIQVGRNWSKNSCRRRYRHTSRACTVVCTHQINLTLLWFCQDSKENTGEEFVKQRYLRQPPDRPADFERRTSETNSLLVCDFKGQLL
jgi:hypothetical protein